MMGSAPMAEPTPAFAGRLEPAPEFRPSEYTGALIQAVRARTACAKGARVLEIGCGSGVVLAALGSMGAKSLTGVDIEEDAVVQARALLEDVGFGAIADVRQGSMWAPFDDQRFDLIVANLPHFPMEEGAAPGRRPTWSAGGRNGRRLLDPFLEGLGAHLTPEGRAIVTHNAFIHPERTRELAAAQGLGVTVLRTDLMFVPEEKLLCMTPSVLTREAGHTVYLYGDFAFVEVHVVEIAREAAGT